MRDARFKPATASGSVDAFHWAWRGAVVNVWLPCANQTLSTRVREHQPPQAAHPLYYQLPTSDPPASLRTLYTPTRPHGRRSIVLLPTIGTLSINARATRPARIPNHTLLASPSLSHIDAQCDFGPAAAAAAVAEVAESCDPAASASHAYTIRISLHSREDDAATACDAPVDIVLPRVRSAAAPDAVDADYQGDCTWREPGIYLWCLGIL